jgi:hypothetical protein
MSYSYKLPAKRAKQEADTLFSRVSSFDALDLPVDYLDNDYFQTIRLLSFNLAAQAAPHDGSVASLTATSSASSRGRSFDAPDSGVEVIKG